ncbi:hypothetical protein CPB83DRAFT_896365 [Crepidotus variabilis]|uniref:Uncharacterized protein n=1 Tax=Crepidotus variabilis TaxID=179855 RepID=A0A9P6EBT8_9AGAR|nr:hypothetical protein CPB83DRAFT_896365 [Crepidotus variabilis]
MSVCHTRENITSATLMEEIRTKVTLCHDPRCKHDDCCAQEHSDVWIFRERGKPLRWYWSPSKMNGVWGYRMSDDVHLMHIIGHPYRSFLRYDPISREFVDAQLTEWVPVTKSVDLVYLATNISPVNACGLQEKINGVNWQCTGKFNRDLDRQVEEEEKTHSSDVEAVADEDDCDFELSSPDHAFSEDDPDIVPTSEPLEELLYPSSE